MIVLLIIIWAILLPDKWFWPMLLTLLYFWNRTRT